MLRKKMYRDILQNKSQFITIFLMILIGVMVYVGIESYMKGMVVTADNFYSKNNLQDLNVIGSNLTKEDLNKIKDLENVNNAERKLVLTATNPDDKNKSYLVSFIESNEISKFYVKEGTGFNVNMSGAWLDAFYAKENNLKVGDKIKIKYDTFTLEEEILGLINVPDHLYDTKDESELMPNRKEYGFVYLSYKEIPNFYIDGLVAANLGLKDNNLLTSVVNNYNYENYIPYDYIMVDVDKKENIAKVKDEIEDNVKDALAIIKIEDTSSYMMYQGEIDEGKSYVGIFSGLFLFIAILSVITTMTRIIKNEKLEIGTLKALGFSKKKVFIHYISYGFYISLLGSIAGLILGRLFIGEVFLGLEMSFFEIPNGKPVIENTSYLVMLCVVLAVSFITYLTCRKELNKIPAESLRKEVPSIKANSINITTKYPFNKLSFSSKWNIRDIIRNKFRTITGIIGIVGCCTLIVCAFGMLNSMNYFIKLQFEELYNFDYKLTLKENIDEKSLLTLEEKYGNATSKTYGIEYLNKDNERISNNVFVYDAKNYIRFKNEDEKYMDISNDDGIYITRKLASSENLKIGDKVKWHIYGSDKYYTSTIVGFNKDPQNQNITITRNYLEKLGIKYVPDTIYTNYDLKNVNSINNVTIIKNVESLKTSMQSMLSMMKKMISLISVFAIILGSVIIYNMGILSYSEKEYQFATLKVLGFKDKQIKNIFIKENIWITIISIIIGLPSGYYLTSWLFKACLDENFDFGVHINITTYILASIGTLIVSLIVSNILANKIKKIDMVKSLKGNE